MVRLKARDMQAELDAVFGDAEAREGSRERPTSRPFRAVRQPHDPGREIREPAVSGEWRNIRAWRASDLPLTSKEARERGGRRL